MKASAILWKTKKLFPFLQMNTLSAVHADTDANTSRGKMSIVTAIQRHGVFVQGVKNKI